MVHLLTLGKLDLRGNRGETLTAVTSRPREMALLIYLATAGPEAFRRRDTVLAMFWPETPEDRARHTLNQMLYELRQALGDGVLVSRGQDEIGVSGDLLRCDVVEFRQALAEARWEDALALYDGPFLPGFFVSRAPGMERWIDEEGQDHRRAARDAAVALSEQLEGDGKLRAAAGWARRAWEIEPSSASLLRRLMMLLHQLGERADAIALFEDFRQRMAEDYGLEPSAETLELVAAIRAEGAAPVEGRSGLPAASVAAGTGSALAGGNLPTRLPPPGGRGLGRTLAGSGAALLGAAAVAWVALASGSPTTDSAVLDGTAPVVVVLPVVVSGAVTPEYGDLGRILTGELIARLGEVPGLVVVPAEAAEAHLQENLAAAEIGRRLRGDAVVESGLDWQSTGVETSAQVTDVLTGEVVWESSHQHPLTELLSAQQDLTLGVASALNVRLAPIPHRDLTFSSDEEFRAWSLVAQAREALNFGGAWSLEMEERARALIQGSLALDPEYAPAHALLGRLYVRIWGTRSRETRWLDSAVVAAERAVSADPDHFRSQLSLASAMYYLAIASPQRFPPPVVRRRAEAALRAVQLNPSSPEASRWMSVVFMSEGMVGHNHLWVEREASLNRNWLRIRSNRAHMFWLLGDYDSAIEAYRLSAELDPQQPRPNAYRVPEYNLSRGQLDEARRQIEAVRKQDPDNVGAFPVAIYLALMEQRYETAEELIEELLSRDPAVEFIPSSNFNTRTALGYVYLKTGRTREGTRLLEVLRDVEPQSQTGTGYIVHYNHARIYAMLGDPDQALHWLRVAIDRGWPYYYTEMGPTDPMFENLLGNEEFERIMADLKKKLDAERAWVTEMLALPEPERFRRMLLDAEEQLETLWEVRGAR